MTSAMLSRTSAAHKEAPQRNTSFDNSVGAEMDSQAQDTDSEDGLVIAKPGETKEAFFEAVDQLIETGVSRVSARQLKLQGAEQYGLKTRFRIATRRQANGAEDKIEIEPEEIVVETPDFSFDDYTETRVFLLLLATYYRDDEFEPAFALVREFGYRPFQVFQRMQAMLDIAPKAFRDVIMDFVRENEEELFDTRDECYASAEANHEKLLSGEFGGDLIRKFSMICRFFTLPDVLDLLEMTLCSLARESKAERGADLAAAVCDYHRKIMLHAPLANSLEETPDWLTRYDVNAWRAGGYAQSLSSFALADPKDFKTSIEPRTKSFILSNLEAFGEHPHGMERLTQIIAAKDFCRMMDAAS